MLLMQFLNEGLYEINQNHFKFMVFKSSFKNPYSSKVTVFFLV